MPCMKPHMCCTVCMFMRDTVCIDCRGTACVCTNIHAQTHVCAVQHADLVYKCWAVSSCSSFMAKDSWCAACDSHACVCVYVCRMCHSYPTTDHHRQVSSQCSNCRPPLTALSTRITHIQGGRGVLVLLTLSLERCEGTKTEPELCC